MDKIYDVIIIGEGPAGLSAAIYSTRAEYSTLLIERFGAGGQIVNAYEVDNYPGLPGISGYDLGTKMSEHVDKFNVERVSAQVSDVLVDGDIKVVNTDAGQYKAYAVILATGNSPRKLEVPGEEELLGCGVSYCATCDGAFFKNKVTAVIGGGDVAVEDAIFLSRLCTKVYIIHRRDQFRAAKTLRSKLASIENIEIIFDSVVTSIGGEDTVTDLSIRNIKTNEVMKLDVSGVFIATGNTPNLPQIDGIEIDAAGYVVADEMCKTNIPGIFAAGDIRTKRLRQVSTAVADGANATASVEDYFIEISK